MKKILLLVTTIFCFLNLINAQAGQLDPTFGNNGIVRTSFTLPSHITSVSQVLIKSDGTIYLTGVTSRSGTNGDISTSLIIHVFANGAIDSSFGNKGNSQYVDFSVAAGALQADGKIVVAGSASGDFALARYNTNGTLDTAFSKDGKLTTDLGSTNDFATSVDIQSDGKIVVAGSASGDFALARYNSDGTPDTGFSKDGKLTTDFASAFDVANSVAIQADGKIVLAGSAFKTEGYQTDFALARYNTNGTLDNSFSTDGKLTTDFASGGDVANYVAIQSDGKIVVAGSASNSKGINDFALARYNADGTLDTGFSKDGKLTTDFASAEDGARYAAIRSDGKIAVAGFASDIKGKYTFALARYNNNGTLDTAFSKDGKQRTSFSYYGGPNSVAMQGDGKIFAASGTNVARYNTDGNLDTHFSKDGKLTVNVSIYTATSTTYTSTAIQGDGKIVMAGYISTEITERGDEKFAFAITRYNTNSTLDSSFSGDGQQTADFESSWQNYASAVVIQSDGKIVVAGTATNPWGGGNFALARYNTDGTLDTAFSKDGKQTTDFGDNDAAYSLVIQGDGKIVAAGESRDTYNEFGDFAIARYNTDGTLDTTFSGDGKQTTDFTSGIEGANDVAVQSDGKIVAAGYTFPDGAPDQDTGPKTEDLALARFNADGTLDVSFSGDGKQTIDFASSTSWFAPFSIAIQSDGKIVAAGSAASGGKFDFTLVRCNADGTLDTSFAADGKQTIDFGSDNDIAQSIAIQSNGKIIAAGYTGSYPVYNFALARFNNNGSLDSSFSEDGKQVTDAGEGYGFISDIAISGNKLYAAGYGGSYSSRVGIAARYLLYGNNTPPTVSITAPTNNAVYTAGASITIKAIASDADGAIRFVKFYNDGKLLGTDSTSPYSYTLTNTAAGNYSFAAKATDNNGSRSISATVAVTVLGPVNKAPSVHITSPADNVIYSAPATFTIVAEAADEDGTVSKVKFYNAKNGILLGTDSTSPYTYTLTDVASGNYSFVASATDNKGLSGSSSGISVAVSATANKAPTVSMTAPQNNSVYTAPATIILKAAASDADGTISFVRFYNGRQLLKTDSTSPYSYKLTNATSGHYSFLATATDNAGLTSLAASVGVTVLRINKAPIVSITSPANNAVYNSPVAITISAAATDADGTVSTVKFYNGATLLATDSTSPYSFTFNNPAPGNYSITAKATDNNGLSSSSANTAITVSASENKAPVVSITSPANNAVYTAPATITINALASDEDGTISSVKFYNGTTYLKTVNTSPYTFTLSDLPAGNYSFTAKATDNNGAQTLSATIRVTVAAPNKAPTVSITSPANNSTYTAPATITINALAADADGTISSVKFYNGTTYLKTVFSSPYTYTLSNLPAGTYSLTAKATDNLGAQTISAAVTVKVLNASIVSSKPYSKTEKTALNDALSLRIAPNPASNIVNIYTNGLQANKPATLSIISLSGNVLKMMPIRHAVTQSDVSFLTSGVYTIKVISSDRVLYKKFVKL